MRNILSLKNGEKRRFLQTLHNFERGELFGHQKKLYDLQNTKYGSSTELSRNLYIADKYFCY